MKRPFGVTLIGALLLVQGIVLVVEVAADVWLLVTHTSASPWLGNALNIAGLTLNEWLAAIVVGVLSVLSVAVGVGILRLNPWAWFVAMVLQGWTLATLLLDYFIHGRGNYASMLLAVVIVFYLNTRTLHETFDLARNRSDADTGKPLSAAQGGMPTGAAQVTTPIRRRRVNVTDTTVDT